MNKKLSFITILSILSLGVLSVKVNAAVQIVPVAANKVTVNTTVSNSYELSRGMTNKGESLYGSQVVPHLVTNKDWGAVSYLTHSVYGSNGKYKNEGNDNVKVTIDGISHYSTTGNITGVMNWGSNPNKSWLWTQTSSLMTVYTGNGNANLTSLENNRETRFIESINSSSITKLNTRGMAFAETSGMYANIKFYADSNQGYPIAVRHGLFLVGIGTYNGGYCYGVATGAENSIGTYRVGFWNK